MEPGHSFSLQGTKASLGPGQASPSSSGFGLSQSRRLLRVPSPQVALQAPSSLHSPQTPEIKFLLLGH